VRKTAEIPHVEECCAEEARKIPRLRLLPWRVAIVRPDQIRSSISAGIQRLPRVMNFDGG
jgi:hypothetical protein